MAGKNVSFAIQAKDEASGKINKLSSNINAFSKEVKNTLKPLDNLGKSLKSLGSMGLGLATIKGGFDAVVGSIKNVVNEMSELETAWSATEKSMIRLDFAAKLNTQLGASSKSLQKFTNTLSDTLKDTFSGGELTDAVSQLAFDKTADQIKEIITVAADLSVAMGTDLNTAVTQLNNTFGGTTGQLGRMFPELKQLSSEALASGEAVELISKKVKGMAEEMANSVSGSMLSSKNLSSDLKEELGYWISDFFDPIRKQINDVKMKWRDALAAKRSIKEAGERAAAGKADIDDYRVLLADANARKNSIKEMGGVSMQTDLENVNREIKNYSAQIVRLGVAEEQATAQINAALTSSTTSPKTKSATNYSTQYPTVSTSYDVGQGWNSFFEGLKSGIADKKTQDYTTYATEMNAVIQQQNELLDIESQKIVARVEQENKLKEAEKQREEALKSYIKSNITGNMGEIGSYYNTFNTYGPMGMLAQYAGEILSMLAEESGIINTFFNSVTYFTEQFIEPLANLIEPIINPVLTIIQGLGQTVASLFTLFQPFVDFVSGVLEVVGGAVYWVQSFLTNVIDTIDYGFVEVENWLIDIYNSLNGWGTDKKYASSNKSWSEIASIYSTLFSEDFADYYKSMLESNYTSLSPATSSSSGTASYTAERDVIVNIYVNNSYVNGDAREIALSLESELKSAHALGY